MPQPDARPGTYALVLAATKRQVISVGRLGDFIVRPGFYVYVGSALGPGVLVPRIIQCGSQSRTVDLATPKHGGQSAGPELRAPGSRRIRALRQ